MNNKEVSEVFGTEFDKMVVSVEPSNQVFQAELFLNSEKVGEVKPAVPAGDYTFYGWQVWNLLKPMVDDGRKLCVVLLLDKVNELAVFDLYQQLCKKLTADGVGFSRLVAPDRLEINCASRKKSKD